MMFGPWSIEGLRGPDNGAVGVQLCDRAGMKLHVDICLADHEPGAPSSPARTSRLQLFLANEGDGATPTVEQQGRVAMAMAAALASDEALDVAGLMTLRERLARHGDRIVRGVVC